MARRRSTSWVNRSSARRSSEDRPLSRRSQSTIATRVLSPGASARLCSNRPSVTPSGIQRCSTVITRPSPTCECSRSEPLPRSTGASSAGTAAASGMSVSTTDECRTTSTGLSRPSGTRSEMSASARAAPAARAAAHVSDVRSRDAKLAVGDAPERFVDNARVMMSLDGLIGEPMGTPVPLADPGAGPLAAPGDSAGSGVFDSDMGYPRDAVLPPVATRGDPDPGAVFRSATCPQSAERHTLSAPNRRNGRHPRTHGVTRARGPRAAPVRAP